MIRGMNWLADMEKTVYNVTVGKFLPSKYRRLRNELNRPIDAVYFFENREQLAEYTLRKNRMLNHLERVKLQWIFMQPKVDAQDFQYLPYAKSKLNWLKRNLTTLGIDHSNKRFEVDDRDIFIQSSMGDDLIRIIYEEEQIQQYILLLAMQTNHRIYDTSYGGWKPVWYFRMVQTYDFIVNPDTQEVSLEPKTYNLSYGHETTRYGTHLVQSPRLSVSEKEHKLVYKTNPDQPDRALELDWDAIFMYGTPATWRGSLGCYRPEIIGQGSPEDYKLYEWYPEGHYNYRKCTGRKNYQLDSDGNMTMKNFCIVQKYNFDVVPAYEDDYGWIEGEVLYNVATEDNSWYFIGCINEREFIGYWSEPRPPGGAIDENWSRTQTTKWWIGEDFELEATAETSHSFIDSRDEDGVGNVVYVDEFNTPYTPGAVYDYDVSPDGESLAVFYAKTMGSGTTRKMYWKGHPAESYRTNTYTEREFGTQHWMFYKVNGVAYNVMLSEHTSGWWSYRGLPEGEYFNPVDEYESHQEGYNTGNFSIQINEEFIMYTYLRSFNMNEAEDGWEVTDRVIGVFNIGHPDLPTEYTKEWIVEKLPDGTQVGGISANPVQGGSLEAGEYKVQVAAFNQTTMSAASDEVLVNISYVDPEDPEEFRSVELSWAAVSGATGYVVFFGSNTRVVMTNSITITKSGSTPMAFGDIPDQNYKINAAIGMEV